MRNREKDSSCQSITSYNEKISSFDLSALNLSQMGFSGNIDELIKENIHAMLEKKIKTIQSAYNSIIKDIRPLIFSEAVNFVKISSSSITKLLTKAHRGIIFTFLE